jgi:type VI secretion system protein ImpA
MPVDTDLLTALLAPIPGASLAGREMRYEQEYADLKEARREDPPGVTRRPEDPPPRVADWARVVSQGTTLLTTATKDLQVAAWLTEGLLRQKGAAGLATGVAALRGILEQYWDGCFPEIEDDDVSSRAGPLTFVGTKLVLGVQQLPVAPGVSYLEFKYARSIPTEQAIADAPYDDRPALAARREEAAGAGRLMPEAVAKAMDDLGKEPVRRQMADLDVALAELALLEKQSDARFGREAPAYTDLRKVLGEVRHEVQALLRARLETDPDPVAETEGAAGAEAGGGAPADAAPGDDTGGEVASAAQAALRMAAAAKWLRVQDPTNPAPYGLLRGFRWGELRREAPTVDPRLLEPPAIVLRARLKTLALDGRWAEVLEQGELLMATPQGRGWLDLQRYALTACGHLGSGHDAVASVIRSELRALLAALPTLPRMTLMDDTPAANDETRHWLETEGLVPDVAASEGADADADDPEAVMTDGLEALDAALAADEATSHHGGVGRRVRRASSSDGRDPFDLALAELAQRRPQRAVELLTEQLGRERSPRASFVRQVQVAYVMVEAGLDQVAYPTLLQLKQVIEKQNLEQWEAGPLVAQPLALLCRVLDRTGGDETMRSELYQRVCRLDPVQGLALPPR